MFNILHSSDWMTVTDITNESDNKKTVEIDIEGIIGGSFWDDEEGSINTKEKMRKELRALANLKADRIIVNINSIGGSVGHGLSIHDLLAKHDAEIITDVQGMTASIATVIAQAGNIRRMSENALYLVHRASISSFEPINANRIPQIVDTLKVVDEKIVQIYEKRAGLDNRDKIINAMDENNGRGMWINSDTAKELGLIDETYEPMESKMVAYADNKLLNKCNLPIPNISNMTTEKKDVENKEFFSQFKNFMKGIFIENQSDDVNKGADDKDVNNNVDKDINKDVSNDVKKADVDNIKERDEKLANLMQKFDDFQAKYTKLESDFKKSQEEVANLKSELDKTSAGKTTVQSTPGKEDLDNLGTGDEVNKSLQEDLKTLRDEFNVTHN